MLASVLHNYNKQEQDTRLETIAAAIIPPEYPYNLKNTNTVICSNFAQARFVAAKKFSRNQVIPFRGRTFFYSKTILNRTIL